MEKWIILNDCFTVNDMYIFKKTIESVKAKIIQLNYNKDNTCSACLNLTDEKTINNIGLIHSITILEKK